MGGARSKGFFEHISHSATLEMKNGKLKLRNSISAGHKIITALKNKNGENVIWYPSGDKDINAAEMDKFRNMRSYEAVEKELSSSPQLFSIYQHWKKDSTMDCDKILRLQQSRR